MSISIIIPVRNRRSLIARTLESVRRQTYRPLNVIIVDNNSTDGTLDFIKYWAEANSAQDFKVDILVETKQGAPAARNAGLERAFTDWTMFFDSDDTMEPNHVARAMTFAKDNPDVDLIGWDVRMHMYDGTVQKKPFEFNDPFFNCVMHGSLSTQRYMAKTELFKSVGGWNPSVEVWNDIEFGVRLLQKANILKINGIPTVDIYYTRESITGIDYSTRGKEREHSIDCMQEFLPDNQRWIANLKRIILAADYHKEGRNDMAKTLKKQALANESSLRRRILYRIAYGYASRGYRGAARILHKFLA